MTEADSHGEETVKRKKKKKSKNNEENVVQSSRYSNNNENSSSNKNIDKGATIDSNVSEQKGTVKRKKKKRKNDEESGLQVSNDIDYTEESSINKLPTNSSEKEETVRRKKKKRSKSNEENSLLNSNNIEESSNNDEATETVKRKKKKSKSNEENSLLVSNATTNNEELLMVTEGERQNEETVKKKKKKKRLESNEQDFTKQDFNDGNNTEEPPYRNSVKFYKELKKMQKEIHKTSSFRDNVDDATELAMIRDRQEKLTPAEVKQLKELRITLMHEVPPQHLVESTAGTHALSVEDRRRFAKFIKVHKGPYTEDEDRRLLRCWRKFCKRHNWNPDNVKPFLHFRHSPNTKCYIKLEERRKFVQFLARLLPDRTLFSVYTRFKNMFSGHVQHRYSDREDIIILQHLENNPQLDESQKFAVLAKILNRTRASVWRRYRLLNQRRKDVAKKTSYRHMIGGVIDG